MSSGCTIRKPALVNRQQEQLQSQSQPQSQPQSQSELPPNADRGPFPGMLPHPETSMNRALYDPPRWGWTALGGIADVLSPHERSRRHSTCIAYKKKAQKLKRGRKSVGAISFGSNDDRNGSSNNSKNNIHNHDSKSRAIPSARMKDPPPGSVSATKPVKVSSSSSSSSFSSSVEAACSESNEKTLSEKSEPADATESKPDSTPPAEGPFAIAATKTKTTTITETETATTNNESESENKNKNQNETGNGEDERLATVCTENDSVPKPTQKQSANENDSEPIHVHAHAHAHPRPSADGAGDESVQQNEKQTETQTGNGNGNRSKQQSDAVQAQTVQDPGILAVGIPSTLLGMIIEDPPPPPPTTGMDPEQQQQQQQQQPHEAKPRKKCGRPPKGGRRSGVPPKPRVYNCRVRSCLGVDDDADGDGGKTGEQAWVRLRGFDMYSYHLGREGMEARDADTGELLVAQKVTDTNHELDGPKSVLPVTIEFPLEESDDDDDEEDEDDDDDDDDDEEDADDNDYEKEDGNRGSKDDKTNNRTTIGNGYSEREVDDRTHFRGSLDNYANTSDAGDTTNQHCETIQSTTMTQSTQKNRTGKRRKKKNKNKKNKTKAMYRQEVLWDLLDANTPTPIDFATELGGEFGLSFGEILDLAARIDRQIEKHVAEHTQFREPIALGDHHGDESAQKRKIGPIVQPYRYDQIAISAEREGGTFKPKKDHRSSRSSASMGGKQSRTAGWNASSWTGATSTTSTNTISGSSGSGSTKSGRRREHHHKSSTHGSNFSAGADGGGDKKATTTLEDALVPELLDEIKRRSDREAKLDVSQKWSQQQQQQQQEGHDGSGCGSTTSLGVLTQLTNMICHICKKRADVGLRFQCSMKNHIYCEFHVRKRLGVTPENGVFVYKSCPICSLICECAKCVRKLKNVATVFKARCIEEKKQPSQLVFPDILSICRNAIPHDQLDGATDTVLNNIRQEALSEKEAIRNPSDQPDDQKDLPKSSSSQAKHARTIQLVEQTMVPRPPLSDFPFETVSNGLEYSDGFTEPYFTVYSAEGRRVVQDVPGAWLEEEENRASLRSGSFRFAKTTKNGGVKEDGNVGYCHICKDAGHLILCDFCPRAFHKDCIEHHNQSSSVKDHWECFVCKKEKTESDDDFVDGKDSINLTNLPFLNLDVVTNERALVDLEILSIIHQMLTSLVDYDFGYMFSEPVDIQEAPGYTDIVKHPMDIGTICSNLINGDYAKLLDESFSMDDLVTRVLNDIELIWRNCIIFNVIGSSVARMALVLRRRVRMMSKRSIFDKLSVEMKRDVENYARKFDDDWKSALSESPFRENFDAVSSNDWRENAVRIHKPRSERKIKLAASVGRTKRVAILDSVSGRIVNMYSSAKAAEKAVETLLKLGHRCEWNADSKRTYLNLKLILQKSRDDPSALLFGFRWLFLDDLNAGRVVFMKSVCDVIEMRHNECTFVFQSIEEALSSSQLSSTVEIDELRKKLMDLDRNSDWTELNGMKWRRPVLPETSQSNATKSMEPEQPERTQPEPTISVKNLPSWKNCAILKKDLVTDKNLVGFDSIQLALEDWIQTAISSPSFPENEARTMENFKTYYLDGDRNVDGMVWESVGDRNGVEKEDEATGKTNVSDAMEIQDPGDSHSNSNPPDSANNQENSLPSGTEESVNKSSVNDSYSTIRMTVDGKQRPMEESSISRKRKCLEDDDDMKFRAAKEARFAVVTVE